MSVNELNKIKADTWDEALRWVRQQAGVTSPDYVIDRIDRAEPFNPYRVSKADITEEFDEEEVEPEEIDEEDGTPEHQWQVTTPPDVYFTDDDFYFDEAPR